MNRIKVVWCGWLRHTVSEILSSEKFEVVQCRAQEELLSLIPDADILVLGMTSARANKEVIEAGKKLKFIQRAGSLYDRFVDVGAASKAGIRVATMASDGTTCVAEQALMLMFALAKQVIQGHHSVITGEYRAQGLKPEPTTETHIPHSNWVHLSPIMLSEKTLGIVGMGEKGVALAERAKSLGMKILYYDVNGLPKSHERKLKARYSLLQELLQEADFVSLHSPLTKETEKMIGAKELSLMKKSAFLVNCSRGGEVNEKALCRALEKGEIAGAGLDVFELEPIASDNPLLHLKNVVLTPHNASCSGAAINDDKKVCANILRFVEGKKPMNLVN